MVAHAVDAGLTGSATLSGGLTAAFTLGSALSGSAVVAADLDQAHNSTAAALTGSTTVAADLDQAHNSTSAALTGSATLNAVYTGMVPVSAGLAGTSTWTPPVLDVDANPSAALLGGSFLIGVALVRPPFLAPTIPEAAVDQFPGLNVNRVPPPRIEKVVVNPNPPRRQER